MFLRILAVHCNQNNSYNNYEWLSSQKNKREKTHNFRSPVMGNYPANIGTFPHYVSPIEKGTSAEFLQTVRLWPVGNTDGPRVNRRKVVFNANSLNMI